MSGTRATRHVLRGLLPVWMACYLLFASGCNVMRHVPEGEFLLNRVEVELHNAPRDISEKEVSRYLRQMPNSRVLGLRFQLGLYSLGKPGRETGIHGWFHRIGEAPSLYDAELTHQGCENIAMYLRTRGFYHCVVTDSVRVRRDGRSKDVIYRVDFGKPTLVGEVSIEMREDLPRSLVMPGWHRWGIRPGQRLDEQLVERSWTKLQRTLQERGYHNFSAEYIDLRADTLSHPYLANLSVRIPPSERSDVPENLFHRYVLDSVRVFTTYDPQRPLTGQTQGLSRQEYEGVDYYYLRRTGMRSRILDQMLLMRPDSLLSIGLVNKSRQNIMSSGVYQLASLDYREGSSPRDTVIDHVAQTVYPLHWDLRLTPFKRQGYQVEALLTTSGSIGMEGNFTYYHRNLFRGAERLEVQFRAQVEALRRREELGFRSAIEISTNITLTFPGFLIPFVGNSFVRRTNPNTKFQVTYNYQRRPDYTRTVASAGQAFTWSGARGISYSLTPFEMNVVKIFAIDENFASRMQQTYLAHSYISQLVTLTNFGFAYLSRPSSFRGSSHSFRMNAEISGNILWGLRRQLAKENAEGVFTLFDLPFSQYARGDVNYSYHWAMDRNNTLAVRMYLGLGLPYGNSLALPFEKKFYQGGANGVRAWHARDLGPGSFYEEQLHFPNQTADMKLELNAEYRFRMFWKLEGALFADAGNIWALSRADERPGALFSPTSFYKQLAMGYGVGLRLNLSFFIVRVDLGIKLHDPAIRPGETKGHWIPFSRGHQTSDFVLHFGVGYPF